MLLLFSLLQKTWVRVLASSFRSVSPYKNYSNSQSLCFLICEMELPPMIVTELLPGWIGITCVKYFVMPLFSNDQLKQWDKIQECGCLKGPGKDNVCSFSELLLIRKSWNKHMVLLMNTSHLWAWTKVWIWWVNQDLQLYGSESPQASLAVICQSSVYVHFYPLTD